LVDEDFCVEFVCSSSIPPHKDDVGECGLESIEWFGDDDVDDDDAWWDESIHKLLLPLRLTTSTSNSSSIDGVVVVVSILFVIDFFNRNVV
jgi:hypothetical protein